MFSMARNKLSEAETQSELGPCVPPSDSVASLPLLSHCLGTIATEALFSSTLCYNMPSYLRASVNRNFALQLQSAILLA